MNIQENFKKKRCDKGNLVLTGNKTYPKIMVEKTNSVKLI